jgi:hypothetical protein
MGGVGYERAMQLHLLDEALGMLHGWRLEVPDVERLITSAQELKESVVS